MEPLGKGLRVMSKIVGAVAFAGIVKGATSMVADMLDPPVTLVQIRYCTSTGKAATIPGGVLGQFQYEADNKYYVQTSTEQSNENFEPIYMYPDSDNRWWVSDTPGEKAGWLQNPRTNNEGLPENGHWQYTDGESWHDDRTVTLSRGPLTLPRLLTVTATGAAADKWPMYLGIFTRTHRWFRGRPVYTNTQGRLLHHGPADYGWVIGPALGYGPLQGPRAHNSPVTEDGWTYWTGSEWKTASVTVTGSE